jgi:type I restriction enzyme M protein
MLNGHQEIVGLIWNIANKLRGPYRPPQYRKVMLPLTVLRRLDCVLEPNKNKVLAEYKRLKDKRLKGHALYASLSNIACKGRKYPLYNISKYTFKKLLEDPDHLAKNLVAFINGFSPKAKEIFENFKFEQEIEKLDNANRLYLILKEFANVDLHPESVSNLQMGYLFEELIRKFNEQANEEAGDHFTPREVIRLMTNIIFTNEEDIYKSGISKTIYDPACGTGGMLSVSEEYIRNHNDKAYIFLYGQEYNDESYAICTSDLLIKDEKSDNIVLGDTLGDGKTFDGHKDEKFHYMLANPPFGVEWKPEEDYVKKEYNDLGFDGRFGPGLPRINDGSLLFLMHMISKMHPSPEKKGDGSKIAIIFNGSPLFTGDAGSGESNVRRWIIENDLLDAIVALPDQLFYNTGISTYIWFVNNKKPKERKGKVQLIDATKFFQKMKKSLGNKRNEISDAQIDEITKIYARYQHNFKTSFPIDGNEEERIVSKILDNRDFGYIKATVERPLRLNFCANVERISRLQDDDAFQAYSLVKPGKGKKAADNSILQSRIITVVESIGDELYTNRELFIESLETAFDCAEIKLDAKLKKLILSSLSEKDPEADMCLDAKGNIEPDPDLRDTENIPLPKEIQLPLPLGYDNESGLSELVDLIKDHCEDYMAKEVLPHVPDAWIDYKKTKVGYEIPINKQFYAYTAPRSLQLIEKEIESIEKNILSTIGNLIG